MWTVDINQNELFVHVPLNVCDNYSMMIIIITGTATYYAYASERVMDLVGTKIPVALLAYWPQGFELASDYTHSFE